MLGNWARRVCMADWLSHTVVWDGLTLVFLQFRHSAFTVLASCLAIRSHSIAVISVQALNASK